MLLCAGKAGGDRSENTNDHRRAQCVRLYTKGQSFWPAIFNTQHTICIPCQVSQYLVSTTSSVLIENHPDAACGLP